MKFPLKDGLTVLAPTPPSSGAITAGILKILEQYSHSMENEKESIHQFVEALKFSFAQRTKLGDWNDSKIKQKVNETIQYIQSEKWIEFVKNHLKIDRTSTSTKYYGAEYQYISDDAGTSSIAVISSNGGMFYSNSNRVRIKFKCWGWK